MEIGLSRVHKLTTNIYRQPSNILKIRLEKEHLNILPKFIIYSLFFMFVIELYIYLWVINILPLYKNGIYIFGSQFWISLQWNKWSEHYYNSQKVKNIFLYILYFTNHKSFTGFMIYKWISRYRKIKCFASWL